MNRPATKAELLKAIKEERQRLEALLKGLSDADMVKPTKPAEWSVKDILAHVTAWEAYFLGWYNDGLAGKKMDMPDWSKPGTVDAINRQIFERNRSRDLNDIMKDFSATYRQILKTVESVPEADMFAQSKFAWTGKDTLADYIFVNTSEHYAEHLAAIEAMKK